MVIIHQSSSTQNPRRLNKCHGSPPWVQRARRRTSPTDASRQPSALLHWTLSNTCSPIRGCCVGVARLRHCTGRRCPAERMKYETWAVIMRESHTRLFFFFFFMNILPVVWLKYHFSYKPRLSSTVKHKLNRGNLAAPRNLKEFSKCAEEERKSIINWENLSNSLPWCCWCRTLLCNEISGKRVKFQGLNPCASSNCSWIHL